MKKYLLILLLTVCLLLTACDSAEAPETRPPDIEPTATYDWMAGESPVPNRRVGLLRDGSGASDHAVSPAGVYFLQTDADPIHSYIFYTDNGSDTLVKLCGRVDCTHDNADCNAYVFMGKSLSYYNGYLYVVYGELGATLPGQTNQDGYGLIRMNPDGSGHMMALDIMAFAKSIGGEFIYNSTITDGVLFTTICYWEKVVDEEDPEDPFKVYYDPIEIGTYYYKLDGSMEEPKLQEKGFILYSCGDVILSYDEQAQNGGNSGSYWSWDPDTDTVAYLTDHPNAPGYFDEDEGYFFRDGCIWRKTYGDNRETVMVDTGLEGSYGLSVYPDCLLLASQKFGETPDPNLYIYNWAFELVDTVEIDYEFNCMTSFLLVAETAERFILTDEYQGIPKYYINKSELGTGDVEIHAFHQS